MALREQLTDDLKSAMREGDTLRRDTIRLLINSLKNAEIDSPTPLDSDAEARIVAKEIKQRKDSITEYRKANREDLAGREEAEMKVLEAYQPRQLSTEELRSLVVASIQRTGAKGPADMGRVMKDVMPELKGRADGGAVNAIAREILTSAFG
ncbi:MAG TPA: GatB/YqeY domain-containing protein [Armatimonadota bacterium]|jgi:hypothetical protein